MGKLQSVFLLFLIKGQGASALKQKWAVRHGPKTKKRRARHPLKDAKHEH